MWPFPVYLPHSDPQCVGRYSYFVRDDAGRRVGVIDCYREPESPPYILYIAITVLALWILKFLWWLFTTEFGFLNRDSDSVEESSPKQLREHSVVPRASPARTVIGRTSPTRTAVSAVSPARTAIASSSPDQEDAHLSWLDVEAISEIVQEPTGSRLYYVQWKGYGDSIFLTWQRAYQFRQGREYTIAFQKVLNEFKARDLEKNFGKMARNRPNVRFQKGT